MRPCRLDGRVHAADGRLRQYPVSGPSGGGFVEVSSITDSSAVLQQLVDLIRNDPHSGASLNLYALVSTFRMDKSGYMYTLRKLRDLSPEHRRLAYGLMELMAQNGNQGPEWDDALRSDNAHSDVVPTEDSTIRVAPDRSQRVLANPWRI